MKPTILLTFFICISSMAHASIWDSSYQGPTWHTNYEKAKSLSASTSKPILLYFSGSDWCSECRKLDKNVLTQGKFQAYAKEHYILLNADFPSETEQSASLQKQNQILMKNFKVKGFPSLVVIDSTGVLKAKPFGGCGLLRCTQKRVMNKLKKITNHTNTK